ncbi:MAG: hypothetical protein R3B35_13620 [Gemmatimonadales bacterium]
MALMPTWRVAISTVLVIAMGGSSCGRATMHRILVFDAGGAWIDSIGRAGEGPGEFQTHPRWFPRRRPSGSLDPILRRTSFFNGQGQFIGLMRWPSQLGEGKDAVAPMFGVQPHALHATGSEFTVVSLPARIPMPSWWPWPDQRTGLILADSVGRLRRTIMALPDPIPDRCFVRYVAARTGPGVLRAPFCFDGMTAVASDGSRVATVTFNPSDASGAAMRLRVALASGVVDVDRALVLEPVRIPRAAADSARAVFLRDPGPYGIQPEKRAAVRDLRVPEFYPPIRDLVVGNDGTLWLGRWPVGRTRDWLVLDERGNLRGRVELPATLRVHAASTTQVWGTQPDRDGVPSIVRYRVVGASPR